MDYNEINFHKINRRPVTDTTYQIAAEEWNALGTEVSEHKDMLDTIGDLQEVSELTYQDIIDVCGF